MTSNGYLHGSEGATLSAVKAECERRIFALIPSTAQHNISRRVGLLLNKAREGATLTAGEEAEIDKGQAVDAWIASMRGACAGLVGNQLFVDTSSWPAPPQDVIDAGQDN